MPNVTSGGICARDLTRIDEGFFGAKRWELLDLADLTVEIVVTLRFSRHLGAINSGLNSVKILCYFSDI